MPGSSHCGDFLYLLGFTSPLEATFLSSSLYLGQSLCRETPGISFSVLVGQRAPSGLGMRSSGVFADIYPSLIKEDIWSKLQIYISSSPEYPLEI